MKAFKKIYFGLFVIGISLSSCEPTVTNRDTEYLDYTVDAVSSYSTENPIGNFDGQILIQKMAESGDTTQFELHLEFNNTEKQNPTYSLVHGRIEQTGNTGLYWNQGVCQGCSELDVQLNEEAIVGEYLSGSFSGTIPNFYPDRPDIKLEGSFNVLLEN